MADDAAHIGQDEIENLLKQAQAQGPPPAGSTAESSDAGDNPALDPAEIAAPTGGKSAGAPAPVAADSGAVETVGQSDVELLLNQAQEALASIDGGGSALPEGAKTFEFKDFVGTHASTDGATLELMKDVELDLKIELGRTHMQLEDVLQLRKGAVVTLDKLAGDPVDIYVNGRLIARGEVLVLNDNFCVRVAELIVGKAAVA